MIKISQLQIQIYVWGTSLMDNTRESSPLLSLARPPLLRLCSRAAEAATNETVPLSGGV